VGVLREFYLSAVVASKARGSRYADVVVLDLDPQDGLFLVVENKLLSASHTGQLLDQLDVVESKYARVSIREYVYLTLAGESPTSTDADEAASLPRWVCLCSTGHVLGLLDRLATTPGSRLAELISLLRWMRALLVASAGHATAVADFERAVISAGAECLVEELNRLGKGKTGQWSHTIISDRTAKVTHPSVPRRALAVSMLPSCSLVIQIDGRSFRLREIEKQIGDG